jgi:hypothetical protein
VPVGWASLTWTATAASVASAPSSTAGIDTPAGSRSGRRVKGPAVSLDRFTLTLNVVRLPRLTSIAPTGASRFRGLALTAVAMRPG